MASIISRTPDDTRAAGRDLARGLVRGDVVLISGPLGAGKTEFVRGLAEGLGCDAGVTSPTFTLIHRHEGGRLPFTHADLYRLECIEPPLRAELDDAFAEGITAIEWPDRLGDAVLPLAITVCLEPVNEEARRLTIDVPTR
jgi:tRNA threonylcarbamoyladenosine biosynthesis protein TsaE